MKLKEFIENLWSGLTKPRLPGRLTNYNIYIGCPPGDEEYIGTYACCNQDEAYDIAADIAKITYDDLAETGIVPSWQHIYDELEELYKAELRSGDYIDDDIYEMTEEEYNEQLEEWTSIMILPEEDDIYFYNKYSDSDKKYYVY